VSGFAATGGGFGPVVGGSVYAGPRAVIVHFAASAPDLAAAAAMVTAEGGAPWSYVVDLATAVSQDVALPAALREITASWVVVPSAISSVDVAAYQTDNGYTTVAAGETGTVTVAYNALPGVVTSGHVIATLVCHA